MKARSRVRGAASWLCYTLAALIVHDAAGVFSAGTSGQGSACLVGGGIVYPVGPDRRREVRISVGSSCEERKNLVLLPILIPAPVEHHRS